MPIFLYQINLLKASLSNLINLRIPFFKAIDFLTTSLRVMI
jgi:hypothetical protein